MNKKSNTNIDIETIYGLNEGSEYSGDYKNRKTVKLGFWTYLASIIVISWLAFISYVLIFSAWSSESGLSSSLVKLAAIPCLLAITHLLVLFKVETARKIAVVHAYLLLLGVPIGTMVGVILISSLQGKNFEHS